MKILSTILLVLITVLGNSQNSEVLKITETKENVVASAIDGTWKPKDEERELTIEFTKNGDVLKKLSKMYYKDFNSRFHLLIPFHKTQMIYK